MASGSTRHVKKIILDYWLASGLWPMKHPITNADKTVYWSGQALWTLTEGWALGKTATTIAKELGPPFTRNSVLGKLFRMRRKRLDGDAG